MHTSVQRWGNSLGLRIPRVLAEQLRVSAGTVVDLQVEGGQLQVRLVERSRFDLAELVNAMNDDNLHAQLGADGCQGREEW